METKAPVGCKTGLFKMKGWKANPIFHYPRKATKGTGSLRNPR